MHYAVYKPYLVNTLKSVVKLKMNRYLRVIFYLLMLSACRPLFAENLVIGGSGADLGTFKLLGEAFSKEYPGISIKVLPSMGSSGGLKALKHNKIDIALTARSLKEKEKTPSIIYQSYASTPLVFVVSNLSKQHNVSRQQVVGIFTGKQKHWPDGSVVRPILRPSTDSDTKLIVSTFIECEKCFYKTYQRRGVPIALTDQEAVEMVATVPGAIGTSTLSLILSEKKPVKALTLDGVEASTENINSHTYPMFKDLFLVYNKQHRVDVINNFLKFISSDKAQSILLNTGHMVKR